MQVQVQVPVQAQVQVPVQVQVQVQPGGGGRRRAMRWRILSGLKLHAARTHMVIGCTRQIPSAYSPMVRSLENGPIAATLRTAMATQAARSA